MKQGKRGIDYDWHAMPADERDNEMKKYLDQFFCFWESSGKSEIAHAVEFLKQMTSRRAGLHRVVLRLKRISESCANISTTRANTFNALPNFNGLKLAGSEITRITRVQDVVNASNLGGYIEPLSSEGQHIEFTPRLNAIIGGRGSGKSVLLDSIACGIRAKRRHPTFDERRAFIRGAGYL